LIINERDATLLTSEKSNFALPINVALIWTALLILYEIGSILENAHAFGLKITWLQKWLRIFEQDVGKVPDKEDQENNVQ